MYWGKSKDNGVRKGQQNKYNTNRVMTVNFYGLKISFSTKFYKSYFQPHIYIKKE